MIEELVKREFTTSYDGEESAERVEKTGEVENVRPEENPTRRACTDRETEEPLKRSRFVTAPEPTGITDLCGGGEEDSGEYGEGD